MNYTRATIGDVCNFEGGSQPPKSIFIYEKKDGYIQLIQTRDYKTNDFTTYIPIDKAKRFCNKEEIVIGRYGPPIFQIFRGLDGAYNVALMKAVPKTNILNDYLYYLLSQKKIQEYVERLSLRTGGQTGVDLISLRKYPILLPDLGSQQKILSILKLIDSKIELNNRINAELEAMAKTIYDYWFVQFDFPNEEGKPYKSSGGKMVWSEELKREVPEGWEVGTLGKISELIRGVSYNKDEIRNSNPFDSVPILRATNLKGNVIDLNDMVFVPKYLVNPKQLLRKFDILITMSSGSIEHIGKNGFFYFDQEVSFGAFCAKLVAKRKFHFYLYSYTQSDYMFSSIKNECLGTNINNLNSSLVNGFRLVIPPDLLIDHFNLIMKPIYEKIGINQIESQQLSELRDWLLPMLMNGQVKVV